MSSGSSQHEEVLLDKPVQGWPRLAVYMSKTPYTVAFSRFGDLNVKNLLYYQAQLTRLRFELYEMEHRDFNGDGEYDNTDDRDDARTFASRADILMMSPESKQFKLVMEIRLILKEYNEALYQYSRISAIPEPDLFNMNTLRKWLRHPDKGDFSIGGEVGEQNAWGKIYVDPDEDVDGIPPVKTFWELLVALFRPPPLPRNNLDLVAMAPRTKLGRFTKWVAYYLVPYHANSRHHKPGTRAKKGDKEVPPDLEKGSFMLSQAETTEVPTGIEEEQEGSLKDLADGVVEVTNLLSALLACLFPVIAISVLSQLHGIRNLLLCLGGFVIIFVFCLVWITAGTVTRVEVFSATAVFSAVLVVFIAPAVAAP